MKRLGLLVALASLVLVGFPFINPGLNATPITRYFTVYAYDPIGGGIGGGIQTQQYDGHSSLQQTSTSPLATHTNITEGPNGTGLVIGYTDANCPGGCTNIYEDGGDGNTGGTGTVAGMKVVMPGNQNIQPAAGAQVTLGSQNTTANPYSFTNVSSNGQKTLRTAAITGYTVGYSICWNRTDCHSMNQPGFVIIQGSSVSFDVPRDGYVDVWWHYTPVGTIQGQKVLENGAMGEPASSQRVSTLRRALTTTCSDGSTNATCNPFFFRDIESGYATVTVSVPSDWRVWYTACQNRTTNCHNPAAGDTPDFLGNGSQAPVDVPPGGYLDFRWHFFAPPKGVFDNPPPDTCSQLRGWACDPSNYATPLQVDFWKYDGGGNPSWVGSTIASETREAAVGAQCGGNTNHGFTFNTPLSIKDGQPYTIHAYAINTPNQPENGTYYNVDIGTQNASCSAPVGAISCTPSTMYIPVGQTGSAVIASTYSNFTSGYPSADVCVSQTANPSQNPIGWWKFDETSGTTAADSVSGGHNGSLKNIPIGWWKFDETSGQTAADSSGSNYNGAVNGSASWTTGTINGALSFNGGNNWVNLGNNKAVSQNAAALTLSAWINPNTVLDRTIIALSINNGGNPSSLSRAYMSLTSGGQITCGGRSAETDALQNVTTTNAGISAGNWYQAVCVINYAANTAAAYVNGAQKSTTGTINFSSAATPNSPSASSSIGSEDDGGGNFFKGKIDDARVYNYALAGSEVTALYNNSSIWTGGKIAGGLSLNGSQYVEIANSAAALHSDRQITVTGWFKLSNLDSQWSRIFWKGNPDCGTNCDNREYSLWVRNDGLLHLSSTPVNRIGVGQVTCNSSAGTIAAGQWYQFAAVINSDTNSMKSYLNGVEKTSCSYSTSNIRTTDGNFQIGNVVNGTVDDFRVYKYALSAAEISSLYNSGPASLFAGGGGTNGTTSDTASFIAPGNTYQFSLQALDTNTSARCSGTAVASCTVTGLPQLYSVSGNVFVDTDKNLTKGGSETNYTGSTSTIQVRSGGDCSGTLVSTLTTADGAFTSGVTLSAGNYSFCYQSLPQGYIMTYRPGTPPSFAVTVGEPPSCSVGSHNAAACDAGGNIASLNFGISNSIPWWQCKGGDCGIGEGGGVINPIPTSPSLACSGGAYASVVNSPSSDTPGVIFSGGLSSPDFGQGQASQDPPYGWVVGGAADPYSYTSLRRSSYDYLAGVVKKSGLTATALSSNCNNSIGCDLSSSLTHGLYQSDGDVWLNASTLSGGDYVILVKGDLHIQGAIMVPIGSTTTFSVSGNIIVDKAVSIIQGFYSSDNSFFTGGNNGNCTQLADAALNIYGAVITNAKGSGGAFQNQRDLCLNNLSCPSYTVSERPDFFLNAPELLKIPSFVWQEVAP